MTARAALASSAILTGTVTAHIWAGGEMPSVGWVGLVCMLVLAATKAVFRGQVSARSMVIGLGVAQLGLHVLLTAMAEPAHHATASHHAVDTGSTASLDALSMGWQMATAHVLSVGLTVLLWSATAGALADIVRVPDQPSIAVSVRRAWCVKNVARVVRTAPGWRVRAPRRRPPRATSLLSA